MQLPTLFELLASLVGGVGMMVIVAAAFVVGPGRLVAARRRVRGQLRVVVSYLGLLVFVLGVNKIAREIGPELSHILGVNITGMIYELEGGLVSLVQAGATPGLTAYFSFVYLYGYAFLLVFPFVAYVALPELTPFRRAAVAYTINYAVGVVCYMLFIAYGPRNFIPDLVEPLLYATYPRIQLLTHEINANTNVFPSLHTSLSVTVALLAWRTRTAYPRWVVLAVPLAASVVVATMYLGIHWATDVVAGVTLGVIAVHAAGVLCPDPPAGCQRRKEGGQTDAAGLDDELSAPND